jgi:hypothetical protein
MKYILIMWLFTSPEAVPIEGTWQIMTKEYDSYSECEMGFNRAFLPQLADIQGETFHGSKVEGMGHMCVQPPHRPEYGASGAGVDPSVTEDDNGSDPE